MGFVLDLDELPFALLQAAARGAPSNTVETTASDTKNVSMQKPL